MDDNYTGILLEEIRSNNQAVMEALGDMQRDVSKIPTLINDVAELKQDMQVVKAAVTDTNRQLHEHEVRLTKLETAS